MGRAQRVMQPTSPTDIPDGRMRHLRGPWVVASAAVLMALVLLGSALIIQKRVRSASEWAARGQAEAYALAVRDAIRNSGERPTDALLEELRQFYSEDGVSYLALLDPRGRTIAVAGSPEGRLDTPGLEPLSDGRVRYVASAQGAGRARESFRHRRSRAPEPGAFRRVGNAVLIIELEPLAAADLQREARLLLLVAGASGLVLLLLAWAFARALAQQERLRDELERGQRLAALGTMSAVLAHELRNPLAALKGHAQLLAEDIEEYPALKPPVERMVEGSVRLERLLDDLLRFVKGGELERAPVDPNLPLREAAEAAGGAIVLHEGPSAPVSLDAPRLKQALGNVLRNAVEATPPGGRIEASLSREGERLIYRVRDQGPGLPPDAGERIFEPFATYKVRGVGLGLAIARRITELHGGTLTARDLPGGGAEFIFTLPVREA